MLFFRRHPILRVLLPLLIGIALGLQLSIAVNPLPYLLIVFFAIPFCNSIWSKIQIAKTWFSVLIQFFFVLAGMELVYLNLPLNNERHFRYMNWHDEQFCIVKIENDPVFRFGSWSAQADLKMIKNNTWQEVCGKVQLKLKAHRRVIQLQQGDFILLKSRPDPIPNSALPSDFDYTAYLKKMGIYYQLRTDAAWMKTGNDNGGFFAAVTEFRNRMATLIMAMNGSHETKSLLCALLLGFDDEISQEFYQLFSVTGTLHVLSVSGLHVGLIFITLNGLLFFLPVNRRGNLIKMIIVILVLWLFALLTGFSPSVIRSTLMFSLMMLGKSFFRRVTPLNIVFASAFFTLLFNPLVIANPGFQLSYFAVIGILIVYPWLYEKVQIDNWILDKIWQWSAVSIAAQLATFPISVYYFHTFPLWFLPANVIIVPLVTLIMYGGIFAVVFSVFPQLSDVFLFICDKIVDLITGTGRLFTSMPVNLISNLRPDAWVVFGIYITLFFAGYALISRKLFYLRVTIITLSLLLVYDIYRSYLRFKQNELIVFAVKHEPVICVQSGKKLFVMADSSVISHKNFIKTTHYLCDLTNSETDIHPIGKGLFSFCLNGKSFSFYNRFSGKVRFCNLTLTDYTVFCRSPILPTYSFNKAQTTVLGYWNVSENSFPSNIKVWNLKQEGFYRQNL